MSIFDDIERDAKAGTQGEFRKDIDHDWSLDTGGENAYFVIGPEDDHPVAIIGVDQSFGKDSINEADMRRFCRLANLERIALAAKRLAEIIDMPVQNDGDLGRYQYDWAVIDAALTAFRESAE